MDQEWLINYTLNTVITINFTYNKIQTTQSIFAYSYK